MNEELIEQCVSIMKLWLSQNIHVDSPEYTTLMFNRNMIIHKMTLEEIEECQSRLNRL